MKTREEVEDLKAQWLEDPCWDLDRTEGFEDYAEELAAFAKASSTSKTSQLILRIEALASEILSRVEELKGLVKELEGQHE